MIVSSLNRCAALLLLALVAGCGAGGGAADRGRDECRWNRSNCMYEGAYEPGEREFAEDDAARLNKEALKRLRRGSR